MDPIARPSCTPKNVANDGSTRAISIWANPKSRILPPLHSQATDAELAELRQQLEGERILGPLLRDHGCDLVLHERAHLLQERELLGVQGLRDLVEVGVRRRERLALRAFLHLRLRGHPVSSLVVVVYPRQQPPCRMVALREGREILAIS